MRCPGQELSRGLPLRRIHAHVERPLLLEGEAALGLVELVLAFEEAFEIDIPDEDTEKIRTVQDAIDYIEKHAKK